jgi:hypothetical protein
METHNWASTKLTKKTVFDDLYFYFQKFVFHLRNFLLLDLGQKRTFLLQKVKVAKDRSKVWRGTLQSKLGRPASHRNKHFATLARLWHSNDLASVEYQPQVYPGKITHFRPMREYAMYQGPELLAEQGVEVETLPVCPAGMLVEPFVEILAKKLTAHIAAATEARSKNVDGGPLPTAEDRGAYSPNQDSVSVVGVFNHE